MPFLAAHFVTLDRQDGSSRAGAEISHSFATSHAELRFDAHALYMDPDIGAGVYIVAPGAYRSTTVESASYLGNVEVGGMLLAAEEPDRRFVLHAGVVMPTRWGFKTNRDATLTAFDGRVTDLAQDYSGTWVRAGVTWQGHEGHTFSQLDIAGDFAIASDQSSVFRINGGGGLDLDPILLTLETVNTVGHPTVDAGAFGIRARIGSVQPYAAFVVGDVQQKTTSAFYEAVTLGVDASL